MLLQSHNYCKQKKDSPSNIKVNTILKYVKCQFNKNKIDY